MTAPRIAVQESGHEPATGSERPIVPYRTAVFRRAGRAALAGILLFAATAMTACASDQPDQGGPVGEGSADPAPEQQAPGLTPQQTLAALESAPIPQDLFPAPVSSRERYRPNSTPVGWVGTYSIELDYNSYLGDVNVVRYDVFEGETYAASFVAERRSNFELYSDQSVIIELDEVAEGAFCTKDQYEPAACVAAVGNTIVWAWPGSSSGFDLAIPMLESGVRFLESL